MDAIVLAGGDSRRMGFPKAFLTLGDTTLIETVISRLQPIFRRVLVVARDSKGLTDLDAVVLTDQRMERGPLVGVARGLAISDASDITLWSLTGNHNEASIQQGTSPAIPSIVDR